MWKSCRKQEKAIREMMSEQRKRAERRAQYFAKKFADPIQGIRIIGTPGKLYYDTALYNANEKMDNLMPWQGKGDNMIDRFDGRALLDYIPQYVPNPKNPRVLNDEEQELENEMNFERYKDLVEHSRLGVSEEKIINEVASTIDNMISKVDVMPPPQTQEPDPKKVPGTYATVGFSYAKDEDSGEDEGDDDSDSEDEEDETAPPNASKENKEEAIEDLPLSKEKEVNKLAEDYSINSYCRLSRLENRETKAEKLKNAEEKAKKERKLTRRERRKEREKNRDRRIVHTYSGYERRPSPTYDAYPSRSPRRKDPDSDVEEKIEFITEIPISGEGDEAAGVPLYVPTERELLLVAPLDPRKMEFKSTEKPKTSADTTNNLSSSKPKIPAKVEEVKLTPHEKLKLKMRMQLNKTIAKDQAQTEKKKEELEKEKERKAEELRELRRKYERSRSRSRSRSKSKSRSLSRSTSRSRSRDRSKKRSRSPRRSKSRSPRRSYSRRSRSRSRSRSRDGDRNKRTRSGSSSPPRRKRTRRSSSRSRSPRRRSPRR